jgi:ribosome maturation factor RimP
VPAIGVAPCKERCYELVNLLLSKRVGLEPTFFLYNGEVVTVAVKANSKEALAELQRQVENLLAPLGYELVTLDRSTAGGTKITLFVDFLENAKTAEPTRRIGLEDCIAVNRAVDELFEATPLLDGHYTLDVSSPGVERPLRKPGDYERFTGRKVRIHTFRPLEKEESGNAGYWEKNQRQKNFVGRLEGLFSGTASVKLSVDGQAVTIPLELVSKANLEFEAEEGVGKK